MEVMEQFKNYLIQEEKSELTVEKYLRDVRRFLSWLGDAELNKSGVLDYKSKLMEKYAVVSVNSILSSINSYLDFIGRADCKVKTIKQQRRAFLPEEKELSKAEYERLLKAAEGKPRLCLLMQTICSTGIRVSEHRFITVEAARAGYAEVRLKGKNRMVFLPKKLCKILLRYAREQKITHGSIFVTASGKPLNRCNIWAEMKKLCHTAGVSREKVFPHNLRHLFARTYYSLEKDIVRLADILGHSSVNTTRIYTMESGEIHRRQIERMKLILTT
ncbi:MAG: tyrosine-type recombinase/integrase [Oscillospiraceae bacterium]|nr:tyrosine-type recombinase/integrase [Oscillospiraceae bacterium]